MKKTRKIFISWLGITDITKLTGDVQNPDDLGPLATLLRGSPHSPFDELWLFYTTHDDNPLRQAAIEKLRSHFPSLEIIPVPATVEPIVDPATIYNFMRTELDRRHASSHNLYYGLSSGTPAMYAAQLLLADALFPGQAYYTNRITRNGRTAFEVCVCTPPSVLNLVASGSAASNLADGLQIAEINKPVFTQARDKVAPHDITALILGETGVGKSTLARYIHEHSRRKNKKFEELNCAEFIGDFNIMRSELFGHAKSAFTGADTSRKGKFEEASGGTLFLDEIGEIPLNLQGMLLRAIAERKITIMGSNEEKKVDVRIIAATNKDLLEEVRAGRFREDLYFRLAVYSPTLKPVREYSHADRLKFLEYFWAKANKEYFRDAPKTLSQEARELLLNAPWRGNLREMEYRLISICILSDKIAKAEDVLAQLGDNSNQPFFPEEMAIPSNIPERLAQLERAWLVRALEQCNGQQNKVVEIVGIKPQTLNGKLKKYFIDPGQFKNRKD